MNVLRWMIYGCGVLAGLVELAPPARAGDEADLARRIDSHLGRKWEEAGAKPAANSTDSEFVRRIYLDLTGRIPCPADVEAFLNDKRPDKRARLIDRLLDHTRYVDHFARVWGGILLPEADQDLQARFQGSGFETWLKERLKTNTPYDVMVRELLTIPVGNNGGNAFGAPGGASPISYYTARQSLPENMADAVARQFLGVRLGCAQCHNHPFAQWKREQFWEFAAFFTGLRQQPRNRAEQVRPEADKLQLHEIAIPNTDKKVQARFLDGGQPAWEKGSQARAVLATWMTAPENPYFARAAVNRLWAQFFGIGIVDPVDDMIGGDTVASHPALLDELAKEFIAHQYDLKFMIGALTRTRAYQLSSRHSDASQDDPRLFARAALRGLTPDQLWDSLKVSTGYDEGNQSNGVRQILRGQGGIRAEFMARFHNASDKPTETQTSILQALTLMNGRLTADATSPDLNRSRSLAGLLDFPGFSTAERLEAMYLLTLSRKPTKKELDRAQHFIEEAAAGSSDKGRYNQAVADIFWTLLNSSEYFLNH